MIDWHRIATAPKDRELLLWYPANREPSRSGLGLQVGGAIQGWWFSSPKHDDDGWETVIGFIGEPKWWAEISEPDEP